jgi:hypothetical protein
MVFEGAFLGLWMMWREYRLGGRRVEVLGYGAVLATIALVPTGIAWAVFAALGHQDAWLYANFASILARQSDPAYMVLGSLARLCLILGPLLICAGMSRHVAPGDARETHVRHLFFGWLIAAVAGVLLFGSYFNHYALPVMLPMCVCAAGFLGDHPIGRKYVAWPLVAVAAIVGGIVVWCAKEVRGNESQLAAMVQVIGKGPECIYVYSGSSMFYGATDRCAPSAWVFPSHISRARENGAMGVDQLVELDRVFARRPKFVILRPQFEGERLAARVALLRHLARDGYALKGRWPLGNLMIDIWELQAPRMAVAGPGPVQLAGKSR